MEAACKRLREVGQKSASKVKVLYINGLGVKQNCNPTLLKSLVGLCDDPVMAVHNLFRRKPLWRLGEQVSHVCQALSRSSTAGDAG
jgi:hypothetical protein